MSRRSSYLVLGATQPECLFLARDIHPGPKKAGISLIAAERVQTSNWPAISAVRLASCLCSARMASRRSRQPRHGAYALPLPARVLVVGS
jgi:hypothetical protein